MSQLYSSDTLIVLGENGQRSDTINAAFAKFNSHYHISSSPDSLFYSNLQIGDILFSNDPDTYDPIFKSGTSINNIIYNSDESKYEILLSDAALKSSSNFLISFKKENETYLTFLDIPPNRIIGYFSSIEGSTILTYTPIAGFLSSSFTSNLVSNSCITRISEPSLNVKYSIFYSFNQPTILLNYAIKINDINNPNATYDIDCAIYARVYDTETESYSAIALATLDSTISSNIVTTFDIHDLKERYLLLENSEVYLVFLSASTATDFSIFLHYCKVDI